MSIVNSILNLVDLNTTKYTKKLQSMKKDTKAASKYMAQNFASIGSAWKAAIAGIAAGALTGAISKELMATEKSVASFITATGSLQEARAQFEMLQQAARDTIQPFDALKAVTLDLRKNGIQATAEQLKTFSQIAYGTGQSIETVGKAFTATMQGRYKALQQLGITAKDNGAALLLTYKGITTEVEKNSEALSAYFEKIGKENEGVLDYLQNGLTGALNHLENAWGDFYRALAESGLGQAIADTVREVAKALDGITGWINRNQKTVQGFFDGWSFYVKKLGANFESLRQDMEDWLTTADKVKKTGGEETDVGILGWLSSLGETAGEKYFELFNGSDAERAYKAEKERLKALFNQRVANLKKGSAEYTAEVEKFNQSIVDLERKYSDKQTTVFGRVLKFFDPEDTAQKLHDALENTASEYDQFIKETEEKRKKLERETAPQYQDRPISFGTTNTGASAAAKREAAPQYQDRPISFGTTNTGASAAAKREADTWAKYYTRVLQLQRNSYTEAQRLRAEHNDALEELLAEYQASATATEAELFTARAALDADYQRKIKEQRDAAVEYLRELRGGELEQLAEEYRVKLEQLDQYHADALISEQEYQEARLKLINDYEKARAKAASAKNEFITKDDEENIKQFTDAMGDLSDAFQNLATGMSESSGAYKALFAIQKSFAVASATANAIVAWTKALSTSATWYEALANYASAVALTGSVIGQLKSLTMHDLGGHIAAGQVGVVGEYGPELVTGPADVTSRKRTAELARQAMGGTAGAVTVNLYEDAAKAGQVETGDDQEGERVINIFVNNIRRGGAAARAMESTYQLRRYGA